MKFAQTSPLRIKILWNDRLTCANMPPTMMAKTTASSNCTEEQHRHLRRAASRIFACFQIECKTTIRLFQTILAIFKFHRMRRRYKRGYAYVNGTSEKCSTRPWRCFCRDKKAQQIGGYSSTSPGTPLIPRLNRNHPVNVCCAISRRGASMP